MGIKLDLFDRRLFLNALYFQTTAGNDFDFSPPVTQASLNSIWDALAANGILGIEDIDTRALTKHLRSRGAMRACVSTELTAEEAIAAAISAEPIVIADGHHRYAIARTYRDEVRAATGRTDTDAELALTFVNELVDDQLSIEAIHRVYRGITPDELRRDLGGRFELSPATEPTPATLAELEASGRLLLLTADGAEWLTPKPGAFEGVRALDGAWLELALAESAAEVDYQHGLAEVLGLVRGGEVTAAILIRPTSLAEIRRTAREGLLMPPKSTFFTPKLRTGLVVRPTQPLP